MPKPKKKLITSDAAIDAAEEKLGITYPKLIREKLKQRNGFGWGFFQFYCVFDEEDAFHTFDDVVRANTNEMTGWQQFMPEGYVAIADDEVIVLALKQGESGVYRYDHTSGTVEIYAMTDEELETKLGQEEEEAKQIYEDTF